MIKPTSEQKALKEKWLKLDYSNFPQSLEKLSRGHYRAREIWHVDLMPLRERVWTEMRDFLSTDEKWVLASLLGKKRIL